MSTELRPLLRDLTPDQLPGVIGELGQPAYRAKQLAEWMYSHHAMDWDGMSNLPGAMLARLSETYDPSGLVLSERQCSQDGTRKYLFELRDGQSIESVMIPMEQHATFCVSSQVGCAMACSFCATAKGGLKRQLTRGEIVEQVQRLALDLRDDPVEGLGDRAFNVVFMGMGEPLDNVDEVAASLQAMTHADGLGMSPRRITISTSGHAEGLRSFLDLRLPVGLTVSVNTTDPEKRRRLMPVPGRTPLTESLKLAEIHAHRVHRTVTVAYVLIDGWNDSQEEAEALAALVSRRPFKVNLIPMNRIDDRFGPPPADRLLAFQQTLADHDVRATIRISGGDDIDAACGQLRRRRSS
jgi:23S rRNA (adenine2503-C2)-methyltransferase